MYKKQSFIFQSLVVGGSINCTTGGSWIFTECDSTTALAKFSLEFCEFKTELAVLDIGAFLEIGPFTAATFLPLEPAAEICVCGANNRDVDCPVLGVFDRAGEAEVCPKIG